MLTWLVLIVAVVVGLSWIDRIRRDLVDRI